MERGKTVQGRGGKTKTPQYPTDLYVLGPKSSRIDAVEPKRSAVVHGKAGASHALGSSERKRETVALPPIIPPKKAKVVGTSLLGHVGSAVGSSGGIESWEMVALQCEPADLVPSVKDAFDLDDIDRVVGLLCGAVRVLRLQRGKPDSILYLGLTYLCRVLPSLYSKEYVSHALCSLLRRDISHNFKSKGNPLVAVLAANLLLRGFQEKNTWPDSFIKVGQFSVMRALYVEDSLGERVWVDHEECSGFVNNILTAINSRTPPRSMLQPEMVGLSACPSPSTATPDDENQTPGDLGLPADIAFKSDVPVVPRYVNMQDVVEQIVMEAVREQLNRRQPAESITRNFLRLLSTASGLAEVRLTSASRLEMWLQNPKLMRPAQELLMSVCVNCNTHTQKDVEVISHLVKIRLKTKALINLYLSCIRELISSHPDNLATLLKHTIYNELSNARNPNNMAMLSAMFQSAPDTAASLLADIFLYLTIYFLMCYQELLMNREDYLRPLRILVREIVRVLRHDVNLSVLCRGLMEKKDNTPPFRDFEFKLSDLCSLTLQERMFVSVVDLVTLCIFLAISPQVREASSLLARGDKREITSLHVGHSQLYTVLTGATWRNFQMQVSMIQREAVWWLHETVPRIYRPTAPEFVHALHKVLFMEHLEQYYNKDGWPQESDRVVMHRLASEVPLLQNTLIRILVIGLSKILSSEACGDQLVLEGLDHATHLVSAQPVNLWQRGLGEISYPEAGDMVEEAKTKELQVASQEKQQILEFESYLAAASTKQTITEQTSLLLTQLITMDPTGPPRKPPQSILDQLRTLNASHRMGHLLCRSRHPDFLLDIIQRQGASQSMPWLADLVENSEGALSHLPVQCLCEFLLSSSSMLLQPERQNKRQQLLLHLQGVLTDPGQDPQAACEVLEYFLRRLSSTQTTSRQQAIKGLKLVLSSVITEEEPMDVDTGESTAETSWLLNHLPRLPHFPTARPQVIVALRQAGQVENDPTLVSGYINFLAIHATHDSLNELTDLVLAREPRREAYAWSESQDQILVTWCTGEECTMHILVVHAIIILLTFGPGQDPELFESLLEVWFPLDKEPPKAYLVDTSEEALLIPDWLKLKMIRSQVDRLVDAALIDLEPNQLVLFIQSFGIPVKSMSKLLQMLDLAVAASPLAVAEAVLDKGYMAQLVEVQHHRGATGGQLLVQVLQLEQSRLPDSSHHPSASPRQTLPQPTPGNLSGFRDRVTPETVRETLEKMFGEQAPDSSTQDDSRTLQRLLAAEVQNKSKELPFTTAVVRCLEDKCNSEKADEFIGFLVSRVEYSCPLLRLVTQHLSKQNSCEEATKAVRSVSRAVLSRSASAKSPLVAILKQFTQQAMKHKDLLPKSKSSTIAIQDPLTVLSQENSEKLERTGFCLLEQCLKQHSTEQLVEAMTTLLVADSTTSAPPERIGLLIDWLDSVELELIGSCPPLQMKLLFSKSPAKQSCRPYLLTLLVHRAGWATLHNCMEHLLENCNSEFDPSAVLDFLWSLTCNPKLWQGREKFTPKHHTPENVLQLTDTQLQVLVDYILKEGCELEAVATRESALEKMESRLSLLLHCLETDKEIGLVTRHLAHLVDTPDLDTSMAQHFLVQLYLHIPGVKHHLKDGEADKLVLSTCLTEWSRSSLDNMSHTVLTALTATSQSKDWTRRSQEYELMARKMAATHPLLVLRQLSMLAASLRGRSHLDMTVLRSRSHLALFQQVMGILELLQPHVFLPEHTTGLEDTLQCYFTLFQCHSSMKDLIPLLNRLVALLQAFISHDAHRALKLLHKYARLLNDLVVRHPNLPSLRGLLSGISLPRTDEEEGEMLMAVAAPPPTESLPHYGPLRATLMKIQGDDVLAALQELDHLSSRKPSVLDSFVESISQLLLSPSGLVRSLAHILLARHFRHSPAAVATGPGLAAYLRCLDSDQADILNNALDRLPEIVLCAQEHALPLLEKAYSLGVRSSIVIGTHVSKTITLLNTQTGC
uniref:Integrator complex subunit 1 n=1 Tax=Timema tahoe TaxID=61484 RepID=A0A7R9FIF6_9NEOP|nr:unnamed protein product [Timema tahoe]